MSADAAVLKSCMLSTVVGVQLDILQEVGKQSTLSLLGHILPVITLPHPIQKHCLSALPLQIPATTSTLSTLVYCHRQWPHH